MKKSTGLPEKGTTPEIFSTTTRGALDNWANYGLWTHVSEEP